MTYQVVCVKGGRLCVHRTYGNEDRAYREATKLAKTHSGVRVVWLVQGRDGDELLEPVSHLHLWARVSDLGEGEVRCSMCGELGA